MKTLLNIIESVLKNNDMPFKTQDNKLKDIKHPTDQSRRHTFRGSHISGINNKGGLKKPSVLRKDYTFNYIKDHPTLNKHYSTAAKKVITLKQAADILGPRANINKAIQNNKQKIWNVSNSTSMRVMYIPNRIQSMPGQFFVLN